MHQTQHDVNGKLEEAKKKENCLKLEIWDKENQLLQLYDIIVKVEGIVRNLKDVYEIYYINIVALRYFIKILYLERFTLNM